MTFRLIATFSITLLLFGAKAYGQEILPISLGTHGVWQSYKYETQEEGVVCYAMTRPKEEKGDYTRRGEVRLFVTTRTTHGSYPRLITIVAGYTHLTGSIVQAMIANKTYTLQVRGEVSQTRGQEGNDELLEAMKRGTNMTVIGRSSRRTQTTDTYSLIGLTRSIAVIDRACPPIS